MKLAWETEEGHLACHWDDLQQGVPYSAAWMDVAASDAGNRPASRPLADFMRLSPFGGMQWYAPFYAAESRFDPR